MDGGSLTVRENTEKTSNIHLLCKESWANVQSTEEIMVVNDVEA